MNKAGKKPPINYRLDWVTMATITTIAGFSDLLSLIPFVGDFVGPTFFVCLNVYFWIKDIEVVNTKRLATSVIAMIIEMIPVVQELPAIMTGAIAIVIMIRAEDRTGLSLNPLAKKRTPPKLMAPLNAEPGIRRPVRRVDMIEEAREQERFRDEKMMLETANDVNNEYREAA